MTEPLRKMLNSKIHGATVTEANVNYEGSVTIPADIIARADMLPHEAVWVWNVTNGARFETYILKGEPNSREFHVNGAAARLVSPGDKLIIASFVSMPHSVAVEHNPKVVFMNLDNTIKEFRGERVRGVG
jgi:aspartate 1-decarboxylase